jgi:hypothetical protein
MTKLSEKDQEWFDKHDHGAFYRDDVEDYLIQKDAEHKAEIEKLKQNNTHSGLRVINQKQALEIDKLKAKCNDLILDIEEGVRVLNLIYESGADLGCLEETAHDFLVKRKFCSIPKQSLAEHDKQVKIDALNEYSQYCRDVGIELFAGQTDKAVREYINQIKGQ